MFDVDGRQTFVEDYIKNKFELNGGVEQKFRNSAKDHYARVIEFCRCMGKMYERFIPRFKPLRLRFEHGNAKKKLIPILRIDDAISRAFAAELCKHGITCAKDMAKKRDAAHIIRRAYNNVRISGTVKI